VGRTPLSTRRPRGPGEAPRARKSRRPETPPPAARPAPRSRAPRAAAESAAVPERLQKFLAAAGHGSRREIDALIEAGRVVVNGQPAQPGAKVVPGDRIAIDGKPCHTSQPAARAPRVIALHKPPDVVCTRRDPEQRATVFELLPAGRRWIMIGRLDLTTSGVLLFTDDGELAHRLMHPSRELARIYSVRVLGEVSALQLQAMQRGVEVDGETLRFDRVTPRGGSGVNQWYDCELHTGRNREVRRLWESQGLTVSRLIRIAYGPVGLPRKVPAGRWFELTGEVLTTLYTLAGLPAPPPPPSSRAATARTRRDETRATRPRQAPRRPRPSN